MKRILLAVCCVLLLAAPAFATGQRQVQCLNGCNAQAIVVQPQVVYAQPLVVQQLAVPYVQQQVIVQKQFVQQKQRSSVIQRQRSGGRSSFSSLSIQRQRSR